MQIDLRQYKRGGRKIYQPVISTSVETKLFGSKGFDALLDTGSDTTYFSTSATLPPATVTIGSATGQPIKAVPLEAVLTIQQDGVKYSWQSQVLFTNQEVRSVLGYIGFLEYFRIILDTKKKKVILEPHTGSLIDTVDLWNSK